ncbi:MAG TPA: permease [Piscirickettsiaceae bacterium]|nr:permease [Piscirickettsiaceae bacterium]HIQ40032.1 permease [Sulfurivirga caldicuralii]
MFQALGDWVAYSLLGLSPESRFGQAVQFFVMDTVMIFFLITVIIYIMGWLRSFVSPERVRLYLRGKPVWLQRLLAIILGAFTPFCSCSSIPLFIGFVEAGIPLGVTFSFLIASPMINEVAVVLLAAVVGWKVAALYVIAGMVVAWFGGILLQKMKPERWVEEYVWQIHMGETPAIKQDTSLRGRHRFAVQEVKDIVGRIWKWVVAGVAVGALFHGFVPQQWVSEHLSGDNWWTVPLAVVIGVPLYTSAEGVVPVVDALLGKDVPLGTTLALMMSVVALSLPEMMILRKVIKMPLIVRFVAVLTVSFILVGYLFNFLEGKL